MDPPALNNLFKSQSLTRAGRRVKMATNARLHGAAVFAATMGNDCEGALKSDLKSAIEKMEL